MDQNHKILVIEDEAEVRNVITSILEEEGFDVYSAPDGRNGLKLAETIRPFVIVCDIMLPDIDGYEICNRVRKSEEVANVIFIFLTAKVEMADLRKGMNCGADDYLTKPFRASELIDAVRTRIHLHQLSDQSHDLSSDKLTLDSNIFIHQKDNTRIINVSEIAAISAESVYSNVYISDGKSYVFRKTLKEWETALPKEVFIRIHRSYIVNQKKIEKIEPYYQNSYSVKMENVNKTFFISERYATKLKKVFNF
mgnify:CR=1 FL=1